MIDGLSATTLSELVLQAGAELDKVRAEASQLRGQLDTAQRELRLANAAARTLKAELDKARAALAALAPLQAELEEARAALAKAHKTPEQSRFSLLEID